MAEQATVLVIEDDKNCLDLLKYMLTRDGFQVAIAEDGLTAQKRINKMAQPPQLVLLGLMLPFVDGYQLLRQIRRKPQWADVPVIVLSSRTQEQDIIRAFEFGASDYVTKPFQLGELLARIRSRINCGKRHG